MAEWLGYEPSGTVSETGSRDGGIAVGAVVGGDQQLSGGIDPRFLERTPPEPFLTLLPGERRHRAGEVAGESTGGGIYVARRGSSEQMVAVPAHHMCGPAGSVHGRQASTSRRSRCLQRLHDLIVH